MGSWQIHTWKGSVEDKMRRYIRTGFFILFSILICMLVSCGKEGNRTSIEVRLAPNCNRKNVCIIYFDEAKNSFKREGGKYIVTPNLDGIAITGTSPGYGSAKDMLDRGDKHEPLLCTATGTRYTSNGNYEYWIYRLEKNAISYEDLLKLMDKHYFQMKGGGRHFGGPLKGSSVKRVVC